MLRTELGDVVAELIVFFLSLFHELLLEQGGQHLGIALGAQDALVLGRGHRLQQFLLGLGQLDARRLLGCGLLAPAVGVAFALASACLGAACLTAGLVFAVFVPLLGAVDFFTAIALTSVAKHVRLSSTSSDRAVPALIHTKSLN